MISMSLCSFFVASAIRGGSAIRDSDTQRLGLDLRELRDPGRREVEQLVELRPGERRTFRGPLHLHERAAAGHHHVAIDLRTRVLLVAEVETGLTVHDADRYRRDRILRYLGRGWTIGHAPEGQGERDVSARDRSRPG